MPLVGGGVEVVVVGGGVTDAERETNRGAAEPAFVR